MKRDRKSEPGYEARCTRDLAAKKLLKGKGKHASRYGVSPEIYLQRMTQATVCAVCGGRFADTISALSKVYDHDHNSMKFRGVIHRCCNAGLGIFADDPEMLRSAANYLEATK